MIQIDSRTGSKELLPYIQSLHTPCELASLEYGDAAFMGNGPNGRCAVGIERKTLHDMLACIDDGRFAAHQLPGMKAFYSVSFLCIEGLWKPGDGHYEGTLMQGFQGGASWGPLKLSGSRGVLFSKLFNYLISVAMSGVIITYPRDIIATARHITSTYSYFQKRWAAHTSLKEIQKLSIPTLTKPTLVRRWAQEIDEVGVIYGEEAERYFKDARKLANSDESDWMNLSGAGGKRLGYDTAVKIIRQINGWNRR